MKVNLLGRCLICLEKTDDDNSSSASEGHVPVTRMTFVNKVLPQLFLVKTAEKEKRIRILFKKLQFCSSGGDGGRGQVEVEGPPSSPPPLCSSCWKEVSALVQILEQLESKKKEIRSKVPQGGDEGAFQKLLRGSEVVGEETKERTFLLLDCLRQELCEETTAITEIISDDDDEDEGSSEEEANNLEEEEEDKEEDEKTKSDDDDVVEIPAPPPKEVPVVEISDDEEEVDGDRNEVKMEEEYHANEEFMIRPDDIFVVEVDPHDIQLQDFSTDGPFQPQPFQMTNEGESGEVAGAGLFLQQMQMMNEGGSVAVPGPGPFLQQMMNEVEAVEVPGGAGAFLQKMIDEGGAMTVEVPESGSSSLKQMFPCPYANCGKIYANSHSRVRHLRVAHRLPVAPPKPFTCEFCGKGYSYTSNLKYHVESIHLRAMKYL